MCTFNRTLVSIYVNVPSYIRSESSVGGKALRAKIGIMVRYD